MDLILKILKLCEKKFPQNNPISSNYKNDSVLDVLIATKLSQNTTDKTAFIAYNNLKSKYDNWYKLMNDNLKNIKKEIKVCGMANTKARDLKNILKKIYKKYNSLDLSFFRNHSNEQIFNELLELKGIGVKTASCVLAFALNRDVFPVDTHIHRVLNRIGIVKTNSPEKTFEYISDKIPDGKKLFLHRCLIKFGRNICKAKNPLCNDCFLFNDCKYEYKSPKSIPRKNLGKGNNFLILENI